MITPRPSGERGHFDFGWLNTFHTFSFGDYYDRDHDHFRALRVINEDWVKPGEGFGTHPHRDMEILTWVLDGALEHQDSLGNGGVIRPGEAQRMSAGTGIRHSEYNASAKDPVHLLQIWLFPDQMGLTPGYEQKPFLPAECRNRFRVIASRDAREGSVKWHQDASLSVANLEAGTRIEQFIAESRHAWVQVAKGAISLNGTELRQGDGAAVSGEPKLEFKASEESEVLLFDLA